MSIPFTSAFLVSRPSFPGLPTSIGIIKVPTTSEMVGDDDTSVRAQVLHTVCDGSPRHLEERVRDALEAFNRDSDAGIRRRAHKVMATLQRTGKWNIL